MMRLLSARNLQLLWGVLVALALALLTVGVVAFFAHEGPWSLDALLSLPSRRPTLEGRPVPAAAPLPAAQASTAPSPAVRPPPGPTAVAPPPPMAPAANAAEALRQVLGDYHDDANHTRSVTLTSSGKITSQQSAALTVDDGLSAQALQRGTGVSSAPR